jgi:ribonuclease III
MITPAAHRRLRRRCAAENRTRLTACFPPMTPQRRRQLVAFLRRLGLDPGASPGPGTSAADLAPIEEALSHSSAQLPCNHERLEFLGDAVLRLAAAEVLQQTHPQLGVGECSSLRAQLVSDRFLAELAERCDLAAVLQLGASAARDRAGWSTVLAESCEALVGGIYLAWGGAGAGMAAVQAWLTPHWQRECSELLGDPHRHNWKSALQEWSQGQGLGLPLYHCEERSRSHGDPQRFHCTVSLGDGPRAGETLGAGCGGSRRDAEQQAARVALDAIAIAIPLS